MLSKTTRIFEYPDGDEVEVTTRTELGAYWKATRLKGPVVEGVEIKVVTQTFSGGDS